MDAWAQLYEAPAAMAADWGHHRIYAPAAYKIVRSLSLVPIVHTEVLNLAMLFPTCWALVDDEPTLCVLRSLLDDGSGLPGGVKAAAAALPLAFQAYPIVVPHKVGDAGRQAIVVDRAIADRPTDLGAPLVKNDGQLTKATVMRSRTALQAGRVLPTTRAISRFLFEAGLLEPWPLQFDLGGGKTVDIRHLMVLAYSRLDDPKIYAAISRFGVDAALFLSANRLSLFRTSGLLSAAKAAVASATANQRQAVAA
jgi:hypothetical protein